MLDGFKYFIIVLLCILFPSVVLSAQATARWNLVTEANGYKIYYGEQSGNYSTTIDVGNLNVYIVPNLADNTTYYFVVTSYNSSGGESVYSTEARYTTPSVCTYTISPTIINIGTAGGKGIITVTTQSNCSWTINNPSSWFKITKWSRTPGSGTVYYSVSSNRGAARTVGITVAGKLFICNQNGRY